MDATDATPMMGPPSTPATTSRMTACCCLKTYDRNLSNYFKDPFWGIKQCRSMENLRNFSSVIVCRGWFHIMTPFFWGVGSDSGFFTASMKLSSSSSLYIWNEAPSCQYIWNILNCNWASNLTNIFQMGWSHQLGIYRHNTNDLYCQRWLCTGFPWKLPEFDLVYYFIAKFTQKPPFLNILVSISIDQVCYHVTTSSIISQSLCSGQTPQFKLPKWWISMNLGVPPNAFKR